MSDSHHPEMLAWADMAQQLQRERDEALAALESCRKRLAEAELYWERWQNEALKARASG